MQEDTIEEKQQFLRTEIIGKEFDAEEFMEFMGRIKNEGDNIDLERWTMTELKGVVEKYKQHLNKGKQELMNSRISRDLRQTKIVEPTKKEKVKYQGNLWDYEQNYEQQCSKSELVFQFPVGTAPKIQIEKFELKSVGGFIFGIGSRNQLQLLIGSNFTPSKVTRKAEDCDWLKTILTLKHPGCYVPALEHSRQMATDDKKGIAARVAEIGLFLNTLLDYPCFHYSAYFKEFLTQNNYKRFHEYKNRESAFAVQKDFLEIQTPTGSFSVQITDKINQSLKKSSQVGQDLANLYGEVGGWVTRVINDMETLNKSLKGLNDATNRIGQKLNDMQGHFNYEEINLPTILLSINNCGSIISKNLRLHSKALTQLNDNFLKLSIRDWNEFVSFDKRHQAQTKSYLTAKQNLLRRKEKYVGDPSKWELPEAQYQRILKQGLGKLTKEELFGRMFPSDNDKEHRTRIWLSFVHQNYLKSFKQFLLGQQKSLLNNYLQYADKYMSTATQVTSTYAGFREMFAE